MRVRLTNGVKTIDIFLDVKAYGDAPAPDVDVGKILPGIMSLSYDETQGAYITEKLYRFCLRAYEWAQYKTDPWQKLEDIVNDLVRKVSVVPVYSYGVTRNDSMIFRSLKRDEAIGFAEMLKGINQDESQDTIVILGPDRVPIRMGRGLRKKDGSKSANTNAKKPTHVCRK